MLSLYDGAIQEAQFLHGRDEAIVKRSDDALFFSIFRKTGGRPIQRSYRMPQLETVVAATSGQNDVYLSQSSFFSFGRKAVNFKQTRAAWVDLDIYNQGRTLTAQTINEIIERGRSLGIPDPTSIVSSGRGCYLKWFFEVPVTQAQLPVWNLLQSTLTAAYASFAADMKARDVSRVFRLIDTHNSKSGEAVRVVEGSGTLHDFSGFCACVEAFRSDLLVEAKPEKISSLSTRRSTPFAALVQSVERGNPDALSLYSELNQPIMVKAMSAHSLNWMRFCDLRDVYTQRGGIPVGERDQALFWMLNFLSHAGVVRSQNWESEISELLKAFPAPATFDPLRDGSMQSLLRRLKDKEAGRKFKWRGVDVDPLYRASNDFLIDTFAIKKEEMANLSTLISPQEKRDRVDAKNIGRGERRAERLQWKHEVKEAFDACTQEAEKTAASDAHQSGRPLSISALATYLGVERTRVSRYWKQLAAQNMTSTSPVATPAAPVPPELDVPIGSVKPSTAAPPAAVLPVMTPEAAREHVALRELARKHALQAQEAANALALERKMAGVREAWARRKLHELTNDVSKTPIDEGEMTMATDIRKRLALYHAASGKGTPAAPATRPIADSALKTSNSTEVKAAAAVRGSLPDAASVPSATHVPAAAALDAPSVPTPASPALTPRERLAQASLRPPRFEKADSPAPASTAAPKSAPALVEGGPQIPYGYPDKAAWPEDLVPPGSRHSLEEWQASRVDEQGTPCWSVEMQSATASWLVQFPRPALTVSQKVVNGKVVSTTERGYPPGFKDAGMCSLLGQMFDQCIWISSRAANAFPGSQEKGVQMGGTDYTVVRSRADYLDSDRFFKVGTQMKLSLDLDTYMEYQAQNPQTDSADEDKQSAINDSPSP